VAHPTEPDEPVSEPEVEAQSSDLTAEATPRAAAGEAAAGVSRSRPPQAGLSSQPAPQASGPDPVVGAGITLLGIFLMGAGGARDLHYVFDVGVLLAVVGAGTFVLFVALSAMKQRGAPSEPRRVLPPS
jgi:hypothetical protein